MAITTHKKPRRTRKKSTRKNAVETFREFAESTTIHGFAYMADKKHSPWRPGWVIVVLIAVIFATYQVVTLYTDWQNAPVITTLETMVQPIQEIKFPAVTLCPQGSRQEILDSVLYRQFKEYISTKPRRSDSKLTQKEMMRHVRGFLKETYPGSKGNPAEIVKVMTSDDPGAALQNKAVLGIEERCDPSSNEEIVNTLNKELSNDTCPNGFEMLENLYCVHPTVVPMSNNEAYQYCNGKGGAELLYLDSYDDLKALDKYVVEGKWSNHTS